MSDWFKNLSNRRVSRDSYTEVTRRGYGSRVSNSLGGTVFGFLLFLGSFLVLWFNEGRAVKTAKGLDEGMETVITVKNDNILSKNDDKLVYTYGEVSSDEILVDEEFGIEVNGLKLIRKVEMYQWKEESKSETDKKIGGAEETTTKYTYQKVWSDELINSSNFKLWEDHQNPSSLNYSKFEISASEVYLGDFIVPHPMIELMTDYKGLSLKNIDKSGLVNAKIITENDASLEGSSGIQKLYFGYGSNSNPEIGDYKISYKYISTGDYSVIAKQNGNTFDEFETSTGSVIMLVESGKVSSTKMFELAQSRNTVLTWVLRFVGSFMMYFGIMMMVNIFSTIVSIIPILGSLVNFASSLFAGIISLVLSLSTIAIAWIFYRPLLGVIILVSVAGIVLFFYKKSLDKKQVI
jgi:hypothetical protein